MYSLITLLLLQPFTSLDFNTIRADELERGESYIDIIQFGNKSSESDHKFEGEFTSIIKGLFDESARVSNPRQPAQGQGGDLTFTMTVDPNLQNYLTVKLSGEDASTTTTVVNINDEQIGYMTNGDYESLDKGWHLPNQFVYSTIMLPLDSTHGQETVEITIKSLDPWGDVTSDSRGFYNAYTHTQAYLDVDGETQGHKLKDDQTPDTLLPKDLTDEEKQETIDNYNDDLINRFNDLSNKMDESDDSKLSIERYKDELMFYADGLTDDQFPAKTPEEKKAGLERIFKSIDNHVIDYYGNTRLVLRGGHQGDWGGYYGALGEALYIVENLIKDDDVYGKERFNEFLDEPFETGTEEGEYSLDSVNWEGEELTRREAWERVLKANFDFARTRLSYIYNQVYYTYVGAWEAHEGLRLIGSDFYEGKERSNRILMEALGIEPFLGEEVLVGPDEEDLDLYHSLFYHDGQAVFTDDFVHIVGKGLAKSKQDEDGNVVRRKPYGEHYTGLTEAGLTRENGYVANYGESGNYLVNYYYKTLGHADDEDMNDEILKAALKSIRARGFTRYSSLTDDDNRVMRAEQVTDERNQALPGFTSYGARIGSGMSLQFASLEMQMAENEDKYSGEEWDEYWAYAREAVGFVQQQAADRQLIENEDFGHHDTMSGTDFRLQETYEYITSERSTYDRFDGEQMAGVVLPQTDFDYYQEDEIDALNVDPESYEQSGWADIDNMYVSIRDGDFRMLGSLFFRNRGMASNGRLHIMNDGYDHIVQIATNNIFQYEDYNLRAHNIDWDFQSDRGDNWSGAPQALAGEPLPISYQPGVGTVNRDNFEADTPYSGYPELQTSRYGKYFIVFNTTREAYGNKQTYNVELPDDYSGDSVLDLISGTHIPVDNGKVSISPESAMVLKLTSDIESITKPNHVDFVNALAGNEYVGISWKTTSGGETYTIKRSETKDGPYETIASDVTGNYYKDTEVQNGKTYYYKVAAENEHGTGWDSWHAQVELSQPISKNDSHWRDDRIGTTSGSAEINETSISMNKVDGTGLGSGDDYNIYKRDIKDSLHYVSQVTSGYSQITTKIEQASGDVSGMMLRDRLSEGKARYIYFGADDDGRLVLQNRTRNSFHDWSDEIVSPYQANIGKYTIDEYPYIRLTHDHESQMTQAFVSKDGRKWTYVTELPTLLPYAYYTGVVSSENVVFGEVNVDETDQEIIKPYAEKDRDEVTIYWNKPKQAVGFNVYRTYDEQASQTDPVFKDGTLELEDDSEWKVVESNSTKTEFEESRLRIGSVHFKVLPIYADGTSGDFSSLTSVYADSIDTLFERAQRTAPEDYTRASFYQFEKELERIQNILEKGSNYDDIQIVNDLYNAETLLIPAEEMLLEKIEIDPESVRASTEGWTDGGTPPTKEENGWKAFDGDVDTFPDTIEKVSWVDIDFGDNNEKNIDTIRYYPRKDETDRINGLTIQGSNDQDEWENLHKITGVSEAKWYSESVNSLERFRYFRLYDEHDGRVNVAEMEFLELINDMTLLELLIDQAEEIEEALYTEESFNVLYQELKDAKETVQIKEVSQEVIDEASDALQKALEELEFIEGVPVIAPIGNKSIIAENELSFELLLENGNDDAAEYHVEELPEGASFDQDTKTFTWKPDRDQGGVYEVTFVVSDGTKQTSESINIVVKGEPSMTVDVDDHIIAGELFELQVDASDPLDEHVTYGVENLPEGATFNETTGEMIWTPDNLDVGDHQVTFYVSNENFTISQDVVFTVAISSEKYTKGSYYLFEKQFEDIVEEIETTDADREDFMNEITEAVEHLMSTDELLLDIDITEDMVVASHESWDGKASPEENGWQAFDDDISTATDTAGNPGWIQVDLGEGNEKVVSKLSFYPRNGNIDRMEGSIIQVSNNQEDWIDLITLEGVSEAKWYDVDLPNKTDAFQHIRYYSEEGHANVAELKFYEHEIDKTLLEVFLIEATDIERDKYTEESVKTLDDVVQRAEEINESDSASEADVDTVVEELKTTLANLEKIEEVNKEQLEALVDAAQSLLNEAEVGEEPDQYPQEALDALNETIDSVKRVRDDEDATTDDVNENIQLLEDAIIRFKESVNPTPEVDKSYLYALVGEVTSLLNNAEAGEEPGQYPESAMEKLENTIHSAQEILDNASAGQEDVEQAEDDLKDAKAIFEKSVNPEPDVDTSKLKAEVEAAEKVIEASTIGTESGERPQSAVQELREVIDEAEKLLKDDHISQASIDKMVDKLKKAIIIFDESVNEPNPGDQKPMEVKIGKPTKVEAGMVVSIEEGQTQIVLPEDLPKGTILTVKNVNLISHDLVEAGDVYEFIVIYPDGTESEGHFRLMMGYDQENFTAEDVNIYYYNEVSKEWEKQDGKLDDTYITLDVPHFSIYGVFAKEVPDADRDEDKGQNDGQHNDEDKDQNEEHNNDEGETEDTNVVEKPVEDGNKEDSDKDAEKSGNEIPKTATSIYNWLLMGVILLTLGGAIALRVHRKKAN